MKRFTKSLFLIAVIPLSLSSCLSFTAPYPTVSSYFFGDSTSPKLAGFEDKLDSASGFDRLVVFRLTIEDPNKLLAGRSKAVKITGREENGSEFIALVDLSERDFVTVTYNAANRTLEYLIVFQAKLDSIDIMDVSFFDAGRSQYNRYSSPELIFLTTNLRFILQGAAINYLGRIRISVGEIMGYKRMKGVVDAAEIIGTYNTRMEQDRKYMEDDMAWLYSAQPKLQLPENLKSSVHIAPYEAF